MGNRKKAEEIILKGLKELGAGDKNIELYKETFKNMNNKDFEEVMKKIDNDDFILPIIVPHDDNVTNISVEKNLRLCEKYNNPAFEDIIIEDEDGTQRVPPHKRYNILVPYRRTKQTGDKGLSVGKDDKKVDTITGQVTGDSQTSKISFPEAQLLEGMGLNNTITEFMVDRGGDTSAYRAMRLSLIKNGKITQEVIDEFSDKVGATDALDMYLKGMHLKLTI